MPFNLLLFPLARGYYIIVRFEYFKYIHQRLDSQKLLFNSVISGIFILITTFILRTLIASWQAEWINNIYRVLPLHFPYLGTTMFSFLFSVAITELANLFVKRPDAVRYAIALIGNEFESLLKNAIADNQLIQISLKNNKFYIGWIASLPIPRQSEFLRMMPVFSNQKN